MYILLELASSSDDIYSASVNCFDGMGYTRSEENAMAWRDKNPEYRTYKYVPDKEISM